LLPNFNKNILCMSPILGFKHFEEVVDILNTNLSAFLNILVLGASDFKCGKTCDDAT